MPNLKLTPEQILDDITAGMAASSTVYATNTQAYRITKELIDREKELDAALNQLENHRIKIKNVKLKIEEFRNKNC